MNDDPYLLASAYLDGELTADERALAESDPVVMSEVEQLRAVQASIRDVEPPTAAAQQAAIAAAMAEFAPVVTSAPPAPAPRTVPFRPRPAYSRYLAVAAAVVAVGLLGVVVVNGIGGGDDDDALEMTSDAAAEPENDAAVAGRDMTEEAPVDDADDAATGDMAEDEGAFDAAGGDDAGDDSGDDTADDSGASAEADSDMADSALGDDTLASETAPTADELPDGVIPIVPAEGDLDRSALPTPEALGQVASELLLLRDEGRAGSTPNTNCDFPDADDPAEILARHEFVIDDATTELLVATDEVNGVVYGVDPDTCFIVVVGPLP